MRPATRRLSALVNRTDARNGVPFTAPLAMTPRVGERWASWVHYGVMIPGLADPERWFGVMAILGTAGAPCFDNDPWIRTTPRDTAYVVAGTATTGSAAFRAYSMDGECDLRADGSRLAFGGDDLVLAQEEGPGLRRVHVTRDGVDLELEVGREVAWFSHVPGVYDHVSLLARVRGRVGGLDVDTLGTWEYAWGAGPYSIARKGVPAWAKAPLKAFTYQVLNLDAGRQLLLTVAGPRFGTHLHEGAWERGVGDPGRMLRDVALTISEDRAAPLVTPDGRTMRMPARWRWTVRDDGGAVRTALACTAGDDWTYGLGAGWVGSFTFAGTHAGREVGGRAYVEWVEV